MESFSGQRRLESLPEGVGGYHVIRSPTLFGNLELNPK